MNARAVKVSKYLAKHLRHEPDAIGLRLQAGGWVHVHELLAACRRHGFPITRAELDAAVNEPGKRRYQYDPTGRKIRAVQGHSVDVDLGYEPAEAPALLYHGTYPAALDAIFEQGLLPMRRQHVHLSADQDTARTVGARRGRPVILAVDAAAAHADGHVFYRAANGIWLTGRVDPRYLSFASAAG